LGKAVGKGENGKNYSITIRPVTIFAAPAKIVNVKRLPNSLQGDKVGREKKQGKEKSTRSP